MLHLFQLEFVASIPFREIYHVAHCSKHGLFKCMEKSLKSTRKDDHKLSIQPQLIVFEKELILIFIVIVLVE
jgi:hypothetical protein